MKSLLALFFLTLLISQPILLSAHDLLKDALANYEQHSSFSYTIVGYYPNPTGGIDTVEFNPNFRKNEKGIDGYDFILKGRFSDEVYVDGILRSVDHNDKLVEIIPSADLKKTQWFLENQRFYAYSPVNLLRQEGWEFVRETLIGGQALSEFSFIEDDKTVDGNVILVKRHAYLNPKTKQLERLERRAYSNGVLGQKVTFFYQDYSFDLPDSAFDYQFPESYSSVLFGQKHDKSEIKVGQKAPLISMVDIEGNRVDMVDLLGKKILLDFSVINCGYCVAALNHFNQPGFKLSDNIKAFYINPEDQVTDVQEYLTSVKVPFSIIPDAKEIAELYGVGAYPTFVLINEVGNLEKVSLGYDKEFIQSLTKEGK